MLFFFFIPYLKTKQNKQPCKFDDLKAFTSAAERRRTENNYKKKNKRKTSVLLFLIHKGSTGSLRVRSTEEHSVHLAVFRDI